MKTNKSIFTAALAAAALTAGAWAQPVNPSSAPNEVIYLPQLPTAADLSQGAAAHGQTVSRIEQTGNKVIAVYMGPNGQSMTVDYELLPNQPAATAQGPTPGPAIYATQPPPYSPPVGEAPAANTVVYDTAPAYTAYPYDYYPYAFYWPWYPAVSLGFGFHYGFGYHYGYGGYYGGGRPGARGFGYHAGTAFRGGGYRGGGGSRR